MASDTAPRLKLKLFSIDSLRRWLLFQKDLLEEFAFSLSLINFWFYREWNNLQISGWRLYFIWPTRESMIALVFDVLALGIMVCFLLRFLYKRSPNKLYPVAVNVLILLTCILYLNGLRLTLPHWRSKINSLIWPFEWHEHLRVLLIPMVPIIWVYYRWNRLFVSFAKLVAMVLFPLFLLNSYRIVKLLIHPHPMSFQPISLGFEKASSDDSRTPHSTTEKSKNPKQRRVMILLFDETDYGFVFSKRPTHLTLNRLDRFQRESLSSTNAYPPNSCTTMSVPSLITGELVTGFKGVDEKDAYFYQGGTQELREWSKSTNIFSKVKALGLKTAAVASYHPLCMLFPNVIDKCLTAPSHSLLQLGYAPTLKGNMVNHIRGLRHVRVHDGAPYHLDSFQRIRNGAANILADPHIDFAYLHFNIPHTPRIFDLDSNQLTFKQGRDVHQNYFDNVQLMDRTLGELLDKLQSSGLADSTHIIFTSDHSWYHSYFYRQKEDWRIPYIVRLAGENKGITFDKPFNSVVTSLLVHTLLKGEVNTYPELSRWLTKNSSYQKPVKCDDDPLLLNKKVAANAMSGR